MPEDIQNQQQPEPQIQDSQDLTSDFEGDIFNDSGGQSAETQADYQEQTEQLPADQQQQPQAQEPTEPQQPEPQFQPTEPIQQPTAETQLQIPDLNDPKVLARLYETAEKQAFEIYKQVYGKDFDEFEATPAQKAFIQQLINQIVGNQIYAYQEYLAQQQLLQNYEVFMQAYEQRYGNLKEQLRQAWESLPVREYYQLEQEFQQAIFNGDFQKAFGIIEKLRARAMNSQIQQQRPQNLPPVEPASPPQEPVQQPQEDFLRDFLGIEE